MSKYKITFSKDGVEGDTEVLLPLSSKLHLDSDAEIRIKGVPLCG